MAQQARRRVDIFSDSLAPELYGSDELQAALSQLARRHRESGVRLLVRDDRPLRETRHPLVELYRRLSSAVQLRVLSDSQRDQRQDLFVLADQRALLVFPAGGQAWCTDKLPPAAREYDLQFEQLWQFARPSPWLRRLY